MQRKGEGWSYRWIAGVPHLVSRIHRLLRSTWYPPWGLCTDTTPCLILRAACRILAGGRYGEGWCRAQIHMSCSSSNVARERLDLWSVPLHTTWEESEGLLESSFRSKRWMDKTLAHWCIPTFTGMSMLRGGTWRELGQSASKNFKLKPCISLTTLRTVTGRIGRLGQCLCNSIIIALLMICGTWKDIKLHK